MYVKLFGGPFDGRQENVIDGCDQLRLKDEAEQFHIYKRSDKDPQYFVYEDTE